MSKRYYPIAAITAVLCLVAVFGYLHIAPAQGTPPRIVLDNAGGRVLFSHGHHADDLGLACGDCHHDGADPMNPEACGSCHPAAFDATFKATHRTAFKSINACTRCHAAPPKADQTATDQPDVSGIPLRTDALHAQCMNCHESMGAGPFGKESCNACHLQRK
ncbi:cytochrome c3 family protein [Desulfovibrio aminophilus]|uniref:cytochrome c3 family protein n=1 Tax=Desulfovibrio aminophilus TaxID=81425 RepID=UPI0004876A50|nr:cytochrome c3 family protein [Desulfovibrio aminophilus]